MARTKAPATGGAEATLKRIDYIEEEAENIQFAIWANRPIGARKMLRNYRRRSKRQKARSWTSTGRSHR